MRNVIYIDRDKCVGCNSCVRVCPSHEANITSYNEKGSLIIEIQPEKCIKCASCIDACDHGARGFYDDTEQFFKDVENGEDITVIVAPSVKTTFDGYWRNVMEYLRKIGVKRIYDVSFGADICTWAHLKYLKEHPGAKVISQPCAAIVNYMLICRPDLLPDLSPIHSPMLCCVVYLRKYLGITGKIAALSPCIAKKDEFTQTGLVEYNVTFEHVKKRFKEKGITFPMDEGNSKFEFDGTPGMDGAIYPLPGGLKANLLSKCPKLHVINSEGHDKVYSDIATYANAANADRPDVFDVLNCVSGCNGGTAIGHDYDSFRTSSIMNDVDSYTTRHRRRQTVMGHDLQYIGFDRKLKLEDFVREYKPIVTKQYTPSERDIDAAFLKLNKTTEKERNFNCHSCGYKTCRDMAIAIAKGLNEPMNCRQNVLYTLELEKERMKAKNDQIRGISDELVGIVKRLEDSVTLIKGSSGSIEQSSRRGGASMSKASGDVDKLKKLCVTISDAMQAIDGSVYAYKQMTEQVNSISTQINLLALNASVEAAHAGEMGKGFSVIADSIRELSAKSRDAAGSAEQNEESIREAITSVDDVIEGIKTTVGTLVKALDQAAGDVRETVTTGEDINQSVDGVHSIAGEIGVMVGRSSELLRDGN